MANLKFNKGEKYVYYKSNKKNPKTNATKNKKVRR